MTGDFLRDLLGRVGESVSVSGLTSLSGRTGDDGRIFCAWSVRFFHGVDERPRDNKRRESERGTGVTLAEFGYG